MRFTIGRLMIAVAVAAVVLSVFRVTGFGPGVAVCGWGTLAGAAWRGCRRWAELAICWFLFEGIAVGWTLIYFGLLSHSWRGGVWYAAMILFTLLPIHLGCGLGWRAAIRRANRMAPIRQSTGPIWACILAPFPLLAVGGLVLLTSFR